MKGNMESRLKILFVKLVLDVCYGSTLRLGMLVYDHDA